MLPEEERESSSVFRRHSVTRDIPESRRPRPRRRRPQRRQCRLGANLGLPLPSFRFVWCQRSRRPEGAFPLLRNRAKSGPSSTTFLYSSSIDLNLWFLHAPVQYIQNCKKRPVCFYWNTLYELYRYVLLEHFAWSTLKRRGCLAPSESGKRGKKNFFSFFHGV